MDEDTGSSFACNRFYRSRPSTFPQQHTPDFILNSYFCPVIIKQQKQMEIGLTHTSTLTVENKHLAIQAGSGDLEVLATPVMMALMENAAMLAVKEALDEGMTTVGGHISSSHLKPTALGKTITATAVLTGIEGHKLTFKVVAEDETGTIGEGEHLRFIVDRKKFMAKLQG